MTNGYSFSAVENLNECISKSLHDPISGEPGPLQSTNIVLADSLPARKQLHVLMVPYPVQGQINPMMQFAKLLTARQDVDITVTMVHNKHNYDSIQQTHAAASTDRNALTSTHSPSDPAALHPHPLYSKLHSTWVENGLPPDFNYSDFSGTTQGRIDFYQSTLCMKKPLKQLLQSLSQKSSNPVSCVVCGSFCGWAHTAAAELDIPALMFWTQSAASFSIYHHLPLLVASGFFPFSDTCLPGFPHEQTDLVTYIPGLAPLHFSSFPTLLHTHNPSDDDTISLIKQEMSIVGSSNGLIINSFEELERDTVQALRQTLPFSISMVGPLLPSAFLGGDNASDTTVGASLLSEKSECINWLHGKPKHSVLYISFGSMFRPSADELESIARGIKSCKQPYLWVIRSPDASCQSVSHILPEGFVEETKDYGLIVPWAPQVEVLAHLSVGAFLTHCGWNSTLESLSMGMPMIPFPISVDQPTNSAYVCDVWKVGKALQRQADGKVKSEDVEKVVRTVLHEEEGLKMRERASKLKDAARQAVQARGSSFAQLDRIIQGLPCERPKAPAIIGDVKNGLLHQFTNQPHLN